MLVNLGGTEAGEGMKQRGGAMVPEGRWDTEVLEQGPSRAKGRGQRDSTLPFSPAQLAERPLLEPSAIPIYPLAPAWGDRDDTF